MGSIKFVLVLFLAASIVALASIAWGRFTSRPKPQVLEAVSELVTGNPAGAAIEDLLGETDEANPEPINISSVASSLVGNVAETIAQRAQNAVSSQAIMQVAKGYDQLPEDQKKLLEGLICQPKAQ